MTLSEQHPRVILYRSPEPILSPMLHVERHRIVLKVVFPAGIDRRDSISSMHCDTSSVLRCMRSCWMVINQSLVARTFATYVLQPFGGSPGWWWIPALGVALKQAS